MVLSSLHKSIVSPQSNPKIANFIQMFPKLNETAIDMLVRNNEPETALDILKQALSELKLSKSAHSKGI